MEGTKRKWYDHYRKSDLKRTEEFSDYASREIFDRRIKECIKQSNVSPSDIVLSVGCGTGDEFIYLKNNGIVNIVGTDFSAPFLYLAKGKCLNLVLCDAEKLPFKDTCVDKIICLNLIEYLNSPTLCLREIFRVLKKNGSVCVCTPNKKASLLHLFGPPSGKLYTVEQLTSFFSDVSFKELNTIYFNFLIRKIPKFVTRLNKKIANILENSYFRKYAKDILIIGSKP